MLIMIFYNVDHRHLLDICTWVIPLYLYNKVLHWRSDTPRFRMFYVYRFPIYHHVLNLVHWRDIFCPNPPILSTLHSVHWLLFPFWRRPSRHMHFLVYPPPLQLIKELTKEWLNWAFSCINNTHVSIISYLNKYYVFLYV